MKNEPLQHFADDKRLVPPEFRIKVPWVQGNTNHSVGLITPGILGILQIIPSFSNAVLGQLPEIPMIVKRTHSHLWPGLIWDAAFVTLARWPFAFTIRNF